jgi:hypothetical protein
METPRPARAAAIISHMPATETLAPCLAIATSADSQVCAKYQKSPILNWSVK